MEELVGEIWDEHDEVSQDFEVKSENECVAFGNANLEKVFDFLGLEVDEEQIHALTINGWIMDVLGRVPKENDKITYEGFTLTVLEMDENRVEKVQIVNNMQE